MFSCILPVYNEERTIGQILGKLTKVKEIGEIICVDESSDRSTEIITEFRRVRLLHFEKRLGKAGAVKAALPYCTGGIVLLFDADFAGFAVKQLRRGIKVFLSNKMKMLVFRQVSNAIVYRWLNLDLTVSGERILFKKDLERIFKKEVVGYQLEQHINHYFSQDKSVYWMPLAGRNVFKFLRRGWRAGVADAERMMRESLSYRGVGAYVREVLRCNWKEWGEL